MVLLQGRVPRRTSSSAFACFPSDEQQPPAFDLVVDRDTGCCVFSCSIARSKSAESQRRFVAFQVEPGSQAIEMGQGRLERDGAIQLLERQVHLVQAADRLEPG